MKTTIRRRGNGAALPIPASVLRSAKLSLGEMVDVREEADRIVIEPTRKKTYHLDKLLKGITRKNQHDAVDFSPALGKEGRFVLQLKSAG